MAVSIEIGKPGREIMAAVRFLDVERHAPPMNGDVVPMTAPIFPTRAGSELQFKL